MFNACVNFKVVSSGSFHAFHVFFLPLVYIPSVPPHSTNIIINNWKERPQLSLAKQDKTVLTSSTNVRSFNNGGIISE